MLKNSRNDKLDKNKNNSNLLAELNSFENIFSFFKDWVYIISKNYEIIYMNEAMKNDFGNKNINQKCYKLLYNSDEPCSFCNMNQLFSNKSEIKEEQHINNKFYSITSTLIYNKYKLSIFKDITKNIKLEQDLQVYNKRLSQLNKKNKTDYKEFNNIFSHGPTIVIKWVNTWKWPIEYISPNVKHILGYSKEEISSNNFIYSNIVHNEDFSIITSQIKFNKNNKYFETEPFRMITKKGKILWFKNYFTQIKNKENFTTHYLGYLVNITEIIEKRNELKAQNKDLIFTKLELLEKEEKYRILSNITFEGILIHKNGFAIDVNLSLAKMFGYDEKELIGKNVIDLLVPESYRELVYKNIKNKYILPYEIEGVKKDGSFFSIELEGKMLKRGGNNYRAIAARDITNRKQAQKEIKKLSLAVEQSANIIIITDIEGIIEYVNPQFEIITGYTPKEAIGRNPNFLSAGITPKEYYKELWETINEGKIWRGEFKNITKDGNIYFEKVVINPIKDNKGEIINFIAIKEDITDMKDIEEDLINSEKRFKALSEATSEAVFITLNGIIADVNSSAEKLTGLVYEELVGLNYIDFIDSEYQDFVTKKLNESSEKTYEAIGIRKDGSKIFIEVQSKHQILNNVKYQIAVVRDITIKKETEKELKKAQNEIFYKILEAEEKERGRISADLHDGIGPDLSSLKLHLNALEFAKDEEKAKDIREKSYRIIEQTIINLKQISKALSPYLLKDFGLDTAIQNYISDLNVGDIDIFYKSNIKDLRFIIELEISLFRITKELINNTSKYSGAKAISIDINYAKNIFYYEYTDNGKGFDVNKAKNKKNVSFGLKNIENRIKSLSGNVKIESSFGNGIEVKIEIPINNM